MEQLINKQKQPVELGHLYVNQKNNEPNGFEMLIARDGAFPDPSFTANTPVFASIPDMGRFYKGTMEEVINQVWDDGREIDFRINEINTVASYDIGTHKIVGDKQIAKTAKVLLRGLASRN